MNNYNINGLGGWLSVVGLGLILKVILAIKTIFFEIIPFIIEGTWKLYIKQDSILYNKSFENAFYFEILKMIIILISSLGLIYLYFQKSRLFPFLYVSIIVLNFIIIIMEISIFDFINSEDLGLKKEDIREVALLFINASIWIPYMILSKRVKNTFIR